MKPVIDILEERITAAMAAVTGSRDAPAIVRPATDPKFGDYQANGVMALAKQLKTNPRKLAQEVINNVDLSDICEPPEVGGAGFINLRLKPDFIAERLLQVGKDPANLGIDKASQPNTIVVDFSGPNIAKHMHVGHLRSTIIGDCICRMLEFLGHKIIRQNHIGDWGRNFGIVILGLWHICMAEKRVREGKDTELYYSKELEELKACGEEEQALRNLCQRVLIQQEGEWEADYKYRRVSPDGELVFHPFLRDLKEKPRDHDEFLDQVELAYKFVNKLEECADGLGLKIKTRHLKYPFQIESIPYESLSKRITAMLHQGKKLNEQEDEGWKIVRNLTIKEGNEIYKRLNVGLKDEHIRGESFYKDRLPYIVKKLQQKKDSQGYPIAKKSDGAICVFPKGFKTKEGTDMPFIIQKSDGAYLYATTDLAALRYRVQELKADRIIYVTDARQKLHFEMLFAVAEMAGWSKRNGDKVDLVHVTFGSVLRDDGTPLKTREGENVKLKDLLDEAVERARKVVEGKNPDLSREQKEKIAKAVGIGAVKYADFSNNRTSDYVFSFDKMLAMDGNTAPYMQYAYARIKSIERKAQERGIDAEGELADLQSIHLIEPDEMDLAKQLIRYGEAIQAAAADYRPNYLTAYLYELAQKFSSFYTNCPVLDAGPDKRPTRLLLCRLTASMIKHGLSELLGIEVVEQM
jgi:arginyl-tRNA synthetase